MSGHQEYYCKKCDYEWETIDFPALCPKCKTNKNNMNNNLKFRAWNGYQFDLNILIDVNGNPCEHGFAGLEAAENIIIDRFTGLKDKNGKEIYENDIVFVFGFPDNIRGDKRKVCFEKMSWNIGFNNKYEVIGNAHQNPELLK